MCAYIYIYIYIEREREVCLFVPNRQRGRSFSDAPR